MPEEVILDFDEVVIMTPSWLGEFMQTLFSKGVKKFKYINRSSTVDASIEFVEDELK